MYLSLQGNVGLGKAIEYFTSHQVPVSIPLNDTQPYDLIADFDNKLQKIQVKTTCYSRYNNQQYNVGLKNSGGNRTGKARYSPFDNNSCDYLFVYTGANKCYLIPSNKIIAKTELTIDERFEQYEVRSKSLLDFIEEMAD